jgi:hypothetical protein
MFRRCWALEKVHGTNAFVKYENGEIALYAGEQKNLFVAIFNVEDLKARIEAYFKRTDIKVVIHGEAYGGKCQGMSKTYGPNYSFIAFDVAINDKYTSVPFAAEFVAHMNLEFVPYREIDATIEALDAERDLPSEVAVRRGCVDGPKKREGVVLRPITECYDEHGNRIIVKHRIKEHSETAKERKLENEPEKLALLQKADEIAEEWVTLVRLQHVLQSIASKMNVEPADLKIQDMSDICNEMVLDVYKEASAANLGEEKVGTEIIKSGAAEKAIKNKTRILFKQILGA